MYRRMKVKEKSIKYVMFSTTTTTTADVYIYGVIMI